jgi:hypothetical protein
MMAFSPMTEGDPRPFADFARAGARESGLPAIAGPAAQTGGGRRARGGRSGHPSGCWGVQSGRTAYPRNGHALGISRRSQEVAE